MKAEMANIREIVRLATTNHGFISVKGYHSRSNGQIANFTLQPLGANGYENLLKKSIDEAKKLKRPTEKFSEEVWQKAMEGQIASWEKSLGEGHGRKNNYSSEDKGFDNHSENDALYIRNVVVIKKDVTTEGEFKSVKSRPIFHQNTIFLKFNLAFYVYLLKRPGKFLRE